MSNTSYAQLYESNQQLQMKIAQLESEKLGFGLFERQIKEQLQSSTSTRGQLQQRIDALVDQLTKQRNQYEENLQLKEQENVQLKLQKDSLKSQRQRDIDIITQLHQRIKSMQNALTRKTEILNKCFKEKSQSLQLM